MARRLEVQIIGDASSLQRALGKAQASGSAFGRAMKGLGKGAILGGIAGIGIAAKVAWDELAEGERVSAQTAAAIKSTGGAAKVTQKHVDGLAQSISDMSGIDDEAVQAGENMLLTFTRIRNEAGKGNDIFDQATRATTNLSVAMGKDMRSSALLVGKALNDPVKGMAQLNRAGIQFTAAQKAQVKAMVETGNAMGAQKVILRELETQFGGSAKAAGETVPGQMAKARNAFEAMSADVLRLALPALTGFARGVQVAAQFVQRNLPAIRQFFSDAFQRIKSVTDVVFPAVQRTVAGVINWFKANVVPTISAVVSAATAFWNQFGDDIIRITRTAFNTIRGTVRPALNVIKSAIQTVLALIRGDWSGVWNGLKGIVTNALTGVWNAIRGMVGQALNVARALGSAIVNGILAGLSGLFKVATHLITELGKWITGVVQSVYGKAQEIGSAIIDGIVDGIKGAAGKLWEAAEWVYDGTVGRLAGLFGIGSPSRVMHEKIGIPISQGIASGIRAGAGAVEMAVKDVAKRAAAAANRALGPSKNLAIANLTGDQGEIRAALSALATQVEGQLASARKKGNNAAIIEAAEKLLGIKQQILTIDEAIAQAQAAAAQAAAQAAEEQRRLQQEAAQAAEQNRIAAFDAAIALAQLTKDTGDDLSAFVAKEADVLQRLGAAQAAGANADVASLAGELKSLREEIERLTGATEDNTAATVQTSAFSGSVAFGFRRQSHVIGQSSDRILDLGLT